MAYKEIAKINEMTREQWLSLRQIGIGGSDAGAILGVNKWKSPFQVYMDKIEPYYEDQSEAAYWGTELEDMVAKEFEKRTGKKVRRNNRVLQSVENPFMIANLDREVVGENAILECKTANAYLAKEWEGDEIPASYIVQVQHYMAVRGSDKAYIAVLIGGQRFIWKEIPRDEDFINFLVKEERKFWNEHILTLVPPTLDGSSAAEKYLKERYKESDPELTVDLKAKYNNEIEEFLSIKEQIKRMEEVATAIENNIKNELGSAEIGYTPRYEVSWKSVTSNRFDSKLLKKDHPEIAEKYTKKSVSRRFTIKEMKGE